MFGNRAASADLGGSVVGVGGSAVAVQADASPAVAKSIRAVMRRIIVPSNRWSSLSGLGVDSDVLYVVVHRACGMALAVSGLEPLAAEEPNVVEG